MELKTVKITIEEFTELRRLNLAATRSAQDAELEVQRLKLAVLTSQKEARDYLYKLAGVYADIDTSAQYELDRVLVSLVPQGK